MLKMTEDILYWLALDTIRDKIDVSTISQTVTKFGSAENIWYSERQELAEAGWSVDSINSLLNARTTTKPDDFLEHLYEIDERDIKIIPYNDERYPSRLKSSATSKYQSPLMLFVRGTITGYNKIAAIVGNRDASYYALSKARSMAQELASHGYTIISGLARGIDREAHLGALDIDRGTTIATLAWLDPVYPPEHNELSYEIEKRGGVISEMFKEPKVKRSYSRYGRSRFVFRNRIISGLSNFLIAIESGSNGGTIWQVELALAQKRRVYIVEPQDKLNQEKMNGFTRIVRMGAQPIRDISDLSTLEVYR